MLTSPAIDVRSHDQLPPPDCNPSPADDVLSDTDLELAAWLASAARNHPGVEHVTAPLSWPAAARARLAQLISEYRDMNRSAGLPPRARSLDLRLAADIHELCAAHGARPELADALILDDDREWQRRYLPEHARTVR